MFIHHKQGDTAIKLSRPVRNYMRQKFMLSEEYLGEMRCFEYEGTVNERQVMRILIFHPRLARSQRISIRTYSDLEQHPEALLYEGYEDDVRGSIFIEDRRRKSTPKTTSGQ